MKKKFCLPAMLILSALFIKPFTAKSQADTSTVQKLLQYIMQPLDKSQIPTGFLEEYGCPVVPMAVFNGTLTDSNRVDINIWRTLYFQMQTAWAKTTANPLPTINTVNATIKTNSGDTIAIPILLGSYNTVKSNAFSSNLLSYNSSTKQVADVPGRSQSPYDIQNLFAASPIRSYTRNGSETFVVKNNMTWNNTGKTISQLQINFDNGEGFKTITIGTPFTINYADTGSKRWTIKATLSDATVQQCYSNYYVFKSSVSSRYTASGVVPSWGTVSAVAGVHSGARVTVYYSDRSNTNTLRKPLIIAEGYDPGAVIPELTGNYSSIDFIKAINEPQGYDFNGNLDDIAGYDLVFIDFNNGTDDIIRNAAVVQEVINRVNANKVNDTRWGGSIRQQNVVMGLSMGGLCARYALANMTKNFPATPTETRLLITHDSPHRGANVPLGMQYLIRMVGEANLFNTNVRDIFPQYDQAVSLLNEPATEQLLLYRSATATTMTNNTFLSGAYRSMISFTGADPAPSYRFIATSLGNECANPQFAPATNMLNINMRGFLFFFPLASYKLQTIAKINALPNSGSTDEIAKLKISSNFKLFGLINLSKDFYSNSGYAPGSQLAIDGVPGSTNPFATSSANIPTVNFYVPIPGVLNYFGYVSAQTNGTPNTFTFVPVGSALDISPYSSSTFSQKFANGINREYPSTSETYIAQETVSGDPAQTNNTHIRFTARNSHWLFNEMENLPNTLNCSNECPGSYVMQGDNSFCTTSTQYAVPGLQRGATIAWSATPSGIVNIQNPNASQTILTKSNNGTITLTATVSNTCGGTLTLSKTITVGSASFPYSVSGPSKANPSGGYTFSLSTTPSDKPVSGIVWTIPSGWSIKMGQGTRNLKVTTGSSGGNVQVSFNDACSTNWGTYKFVTVGPGGPASDRIALSPDSSDNVTANESGDWSISPNPARTVITIKQNVPPGVVALKEIKMFDLSGKLVKHKRLDTQSNQLELSVSELPAGVYIVELSNRVRRVQKRIVVIR